MIYNEMICGKFVDMRSITLEDTEFSYYIRADKKNRETVGQLAASIEKQRKFIEWQMQEPDDYYFVVLNKKSEKIGLIGVYDIHDGMGEFGREVSFGNPMQTMEAELLLEDFCRDVLHLKKICWVIYLNNRKHISDQKKKGLQPLLVTVRNGVDCAYYEAELGTGSPNDKRRKMLDIIGVDQSE